MKKTKEIHEKTPEELDKSLDEARKELFNLRLHAQTGQLDNPARIGQLRKEIARLETEKTARRIQAL